MNYFKISILALFLLASLSGDVWARSEIILADFDTGDPPNNVGGGFGAWDKDPWDDSQFAEMSLEIDDALGDPSGYSIRIDYDVESKALAYNGFWMKLGGFDATPYNYLCFYIRGDEELGYSKRVKVELKDLTGSSSSHVIRNYNHQWKKIRIPFTKFKRLANWERLNEFVIVFDDMLSDPKVGTIYIDHITLERR